MNYSSLLLLQGCRCNASAVQMDFALAHGYKIPQTWEFDIFPGGISDTSADYYERLIREVGVSEISWEQRDGTGGSEDEDNDPSSVDPQLQSADEDGPTGNVSCPCDQEEDDGSSYESSCNYQWDEGWNVE